MILVIDNYDSFVHNLARYIRELGWATSVVRNDAIDEAGVAAIAPSHIVLSPGPCAPSPCVLAPGPRPPAQAGIAVALVDRFAAPAPILGICLGHQCIGQALGGGVVRARRPMHGKVSEIHHDGTGVFAGLPNPLRG